MKLCILGYNSAFPTSNKNTTSQILMVENYFFIIDCGEGIQKQLRKIKIKFNKIKAIFISHLHGDHILGLIGLLLTLNILGRKNELLLYAPKNINNFIETQFKIMNCSINFSINIIELEKNISEIIYKDKNIIVKTIPLDHTIYTNGFIFTTIAKKPKLNIEIIKEYNEIDICDYNKIKNGSDIILKSGKIIKNETLIIQNDSIKSYSFCSDTRLNTDIIDIIKNTDLLYHETTFLEKDKKIAINTGHSTSIDSADIAIKSNAKKLILGHFSNRYREYNTFLDEAKYIFNNTYLPETLKFINI